MIGNNLTNSLGSPFSQTEMELCKDFLISCQKTHEQAPLTYLVSMTSDVIYAGNPEENPMKTKLLEGLFHDKAESKLAWYTYPSVDFD